MRRIAVLSAVLLAALALTGPPATAGEMGGKKYVANMSGAQETEGGDPDGTGKADVAIDADAGQVCYTLTYDKIGKPDKAHIHRGAAKASGDVVVNLDPAKSGQCAPGDKAVLKEIQSNPGGFYVNVHNPEYPKGAIRGQLEPAR